MKVTPQGNSVFLVFSRTHLKIDDNHPEATHDSSITYAVADVPAAVGHGRAAVAAAAPLSAVGPAVRAAPVRPRAGARSAVVSAGATVGVGSAG